MNPTHFMCTSASSLASSAWKEGAAIKGLTGFILLGLSVVGGYAAGDYRNGLNRKAHELDKDIAVQLATIAADASNASFKENMIKKN